MKAYSPEPLTPEERELAKLTAHLGPQGEPSSALDAKILAAAHAALERKQPTRRRPRWPVAMGLAASVVFAVGIAWQLRPLQQAPTMTAAEAPADEADRAAAVVLAAPMHEPELGEIAEQARPEAPPSIAPGQTEQAPPAAAKAIVAPPPPPESRAEPSRQAARPAVRASERERQARVVGNLGAVSSPPPPLAPPAPAVMTAAPAPAPAADASYPFAADPHDGYSARAADAEASAASAGAAAAKPQADTLAEAKAARAASFARQKESDTLDRIEVTGSRLKRTDLQVPVSDDAQLPVNEWLERVRTRYGLGDAGAAKQSLLLFVKDHPSEPVPGDLEPLLDE